MFRMRFAVAEDVPACVAMVPHVLGGDSCQTLRNGTRCWQRLLEQGRALAAVVVNEDDEPVGFGLSMFLSDEFRQVLIQQATVPMGQALLLWAERNSVLRPQEIMAAHRGDGLNLLGFYGWRADLSAPATERVKQLLWVSFLLIHQGYHLKSFLKEIYGQQEYDFYTQMGLTVYREHPAVGITPQRYLVGVQRSESYLPKRIADIFHADSPPIHLSDRCREVGQLGYLLQLKNAQIADCLGISLSTVYVMWHRLWKQIRQQAINFPAPLLSLSRARTDGMHYIAHYPELIYPLSIHTLFYCRPELARRYLIPVTERLQPKAVVRPISEPVLESPQGP